MNFRSTMTPEQLAAKKRIEAMQKSVIVSMNSREKYEDMLERTLFAPARKICEDLQANPIPAADLTEDQKKAIYLMAGFLNLEGGKLTSIGPVGIADRGDGGYIVSMAAEVLPS